MTFHETWPYNLVTSSPKLNLALFIEKICKNDCPLDGLVQSCSNSIDDALELLQSCTKPSNYVVLFILRRSVTVFVVRRHCRSCSVRCRAVGQCNRTRWWMYWTYTRGSCTDCGESWHPGELGHLCWSLHCHIQHRVVLYWPCMIVPHKWTKIWWIATAN